MPTRSIQPLIKALHALAMLLIAGLFSSAAFAVDTDGDGCWDGYHPDGGSCIEFDHTQSGSRMQLSFSNRCDGRLFMTWCVEAKCATGALRAGQSMTKYVYTEGNNAKVFSIGSNNSSKDSICRDRNGRW